MKDTWITLTIKLLKGVSITFKVFGYLLFILSFFSFLISLVGYLVPERAGYFQPGDVIAQIIFGAFCYILGRWGEKKSHNWGVKLVENAAKNKLSVIHYMLKHEEKKLKSKPRRDVIQARCGGREIKVLVQGGSGWEMLSGKSILLSLSPDCLYLAEPDGRNEIEILAKEITDINIGGPGAVTTGGGFAGGGFGVQGFLVGAAAASLLNLLTTNTSTKTLVRICTNSTELFLLISSLDPEEMRIYLSPLHIHLSQFKRKVTLEQESDLTSTIIRLDEMRKVGTINDDEFALLKRSALEKVT